MPLVRYIVSAGLMVSTLGFTACAPTQNTRGYFADDVLISGIVRGIDDKSRVLDVLGSPSNVSTLGTSTWYYITRKTESLAFFEKKVLEQKVVAIKFDDDGLVSDIQRYDTEDGRDIAFSERVTPTRGKQLSLFQQLFGNIGRFSGDPESQ